MKLTSEFRGSHLELRARIGAGVCLLALLFAPPVKAQSGNEGSIEGTLTDPSGAVVPHVVLTARNANTAATYATTSDTEGFFRFLILPVGTYELVAECLGFAPFIQKDVVVTIGARITLPLTLPLAAHTESVVVSGHTPLLEPTRSPVSSTVDARTVASLPVNGRNFYAFTLLTPGVIRESGGGTSFGGLTLMNLLLVDGADNNNTFNGFPLGGLGLTPFQISLEAVQEFQVNTNSYSAELGRAGGGEINVVTKSGTNDFHGSLFWYFRDRALNATDTIDKARGNPKDAFHIHQFGAAVGGPIRRNRLFFFASYDAQRRNQQNQVFLNLPSGFSLSSNPTIAAFQQRALDYLAPRAASWILSFNANVYLAKVDWHITPHHLFSGRWSGHRFAGTNLERRGAQDSLEHTGASGQESDTLAVSLTSTLSPSCVNVARFSYVHNHDPSGRNSVNPEAQVFEGGQLVLNVGGFASSPRDNAIRRGEWSDTLSFSRGRHAVKVGANVLVDRIMFFTAVNFSGSYRFNSLAAFGRNLAGMPVPAAGDRFTQAFSGEGTPGITVHPNAVEFAGFVQDEWRVRPKLTFNLGLRYDVQVMAEARVKNPSPALAAAGIDTSFIARDTNNFAPRFGFAWSPLRNGRLVVRGGYGLFYARTANAMARTHHFQNGITVQTRTFTGTSIPLYPNTFCGPPDPSGEPPSCAAPATGGAPPLLMLLDSDFTQPYVQQGSSGFEYELAKDLALSVSYLWVQGTHLPRYRDVNLLAPAATTIRVAGTSNELTYLRFPGRPTGSPTRLIPDFDRILLLESAANSSYHGMAVQLNKRFSHNLQFSASYTLSKVINDITNPAPINIPDGDGSLLSNSFNPRLDRAAGVSDRRHRFVLSGIWQLNYGHSLPASAKAILTGWELSGILTAQSGPPYSGLVNFDLNNDGNPATDRTPGLGRNAFYLPATVSFDSRLTRSVQFTERVRLQFIWEAFNMFNRANISAVRTAQFFRSTSADDCGIAGTPCLVPQNTGETAFGTPTATLGPRIMQFALKLLF